MDPVRRTEEKSIRELLADATSQTAELMRKEMQLARLEISESVATLKAAAVSLGAGAVVGVAGLLVLLAAAVLGLDEWLHELWLSALIVGAVVIAIAAALIAAGRRTMSSEHLLPERTPESLRRDKQLVQQHL